MKLIMSIFLMAGVLFANEHFDKNSEYVCLNTYSIEAGKRFEVKKEDAIKKPLFVFFKEDKLYINKSMEFTFKMKRGDMLSYSNDELMLLLTSNLGLGLVPKKARGQQQYFFKCEQKI